MPFSWLLLDEPFSALDEVNTQKAIALIKAVTAENNAGLILSNLYSDSYFDYTKKVRMA
jgi:energy-coupling factor transporter ATP-binding protein EcfA2